MYKDEENIEPEFMKRPGTNPFRTPEGYFDSIEELIMDKIQAQEKKKNSSMKILRILKPALALAACIVLALMLVKYPVTKTNITPDMLSNLTSPANDDSTLNFSMIDENTLISAIFSDEKTTVEEINPDDMLAYLSSGLNEIEIYSEIQK